MAKYYATLISFFVFSTLLAQQNLKSFKVKYITSPITLDGALDEEVWQTGESANSFQQYFPTDSLQANYQTTIKMCFDDKNLYIGIKQNAKSNDFTITSLRRDFRAGGTDNISLLFDTFNDGTNAFLFGINPYGVRREALISNGGQAIRDFTTSWDVKWRGESKIYDSYYTSEMVIPLTSFKFKEGETKWRFNSYRFDVQGNEQSTWVTIPQNQIIFSLAFMGEMVFEKPLGKSKTPIALIPYVNGITAEDFENNETLSNFKVGGDAKISIGNSLNLDVTVNPDFSTVEVDNFITNLTRFEVALPERRQFFVDNNDLFGSFGGQRDANPFFSRRIGIASDNDGETIENRILAGVRLSGKVNNNLRLGLLSIQTEEDEANGIPSNNNSMLALQHKVFSRSNISAFFINRETFNNPNFIEDGEEFNRVLGIDYNLASVDNKWIGKFYAHKSFDPEDSQGNYSLGTFLNYNVRNYGVFTDIVFIDEDFNSDLGFIRRTDIFKSAIGYNRNIWPTKGKINRHNIQLFAVSTWRPTLDYQNTDSDINLSWDAEFKNQVNLGANITRSFIFLTDGFEPTGIEDAIPLPADTGYNFYNAQVQYRSDRRKNFSYSFRQQFGGFFNGNLYSSNANLSLRVQPKFNISIEGRYDRLDFPQPFSSANIWLITPRVDYTFSKSIFWSTLVQYSNQRDNLGINTRLQWRFAPLSDLFIVYNDNYFVESFAPRTRSLNVKLTYWLNI